MVIHVCVTALCQFLANPSVYGRCPKLSIGIKGIEPTTWEGIGWWEGINPIHAWMILSPSLKECNYELRVTKSNSCFTKFLVNIIHIYGHKLIYYENIFRN